MSLCKQDKITKIGFITRLISIESQPKKIVVVVVVVIGVVVVIHVVVVGALKLKCPSLIIFLFSCLS